MCIKSVLFCKLDRSLPKDSGKRYQQVVARRRNTHRVRKRAGNISESCHPLSKNFSQVNNRRLVASELKKSVKRHNCRFVH